MQFWTWNARSDRGLAIRVSISLSRLSDRTIAPEYLKELVVPRKQSVKSVRLDDDYFILDYPACPNYLNTYKAFTYSSAKVFNSLPYHIRSAESVLLFKSKLKTYFFSLAFGI